MTALPLREIGLALLVGFLFAASPMTSLDPVRSAIAGSLIAAGLIVYRLRTASGPERTDDDATDTGGAGTRPPVAAIACLLLFVAVVSPTLMWLWDNWTRSVWTNNHGIFIPLIVGYLAVNALRADRNPAPDASPQGFVWLGAALLLLVADAYLATRYLSVIAIVVGLPGLSLLFLGKARTRLLRVPLAIALLAIPIPAAVATDLYLRHATASMVEPMVRMLGIATYREATVIFLPRHTFVVAEACSGFNTLYASMATSIILSCFVRRWRHKLVLLALAPVLAIIANSIRIFGLVLLTIRFGDWVIDSPLHPLSGVLAFALALLVLFGASSRMENLPTAPAGQRT